MKINCHMEIVNRGTREEGGGTNVLSSLVPRPSVTVVLRNTLAIVCFCVTAWTAAQAALDGPGSGLVGWWKFDEGQGTRVMDTSGYGNNGTLVNGPTWTTGHVRGALSFNGVSQYVNVPDNAVFNGQTALSLSFWMYANSFALYEHPLAKGGLGYGTDSVWSINEYVGNGQNRLYFTLVNSTPSKSGDLWLTFASGDFGKWNHIVCTYDGSTITLYFNGAFATSTPFSGTLNTMSEPVTMGAEYGPAQFFSGSIDDVRIYNRALSASEVTELYNYTPPPPQPPDTTPPVVSGGAPTGWLPSGTTQTTLSVTTDENAVCKYCMTYGAPFVSMSNVFSTTGGTTHQTTITGLQDDQSYFYYVACSDYAGNIDTRNTSIIFSVAPANASPSPSSTIPPPYNPPVPSGSYTLASGPFTVENLGSLLKGNAQEKQIMFRLSNNDLHLIFYYEMAQNWSLYPMQIVDVNITQGTYRMVDGIPGRPGPNATMLYTNDKIYLASGASMGDSGRSWFMEYDPVTGAINVIAQLTQTDGQYVEAGDDGWIYIGECCHGGVDRYNPAARVFERLGVMDENGGSYQYAYTVGADNRYLYVGMGEMPWYLAVYDTQTQTKTLYWKNDNYTQGYPQVLRGRSGGWYYEGVNSSGDTVWYVLQNGQPTQIGYVPSVYYYFEHGNVVSSATDAFPSRFGVEVNLDTTYPDSGNGRVATIKWRQVGAPDWQSITISGFRLAPIPIKRLYSWDAEHFFGWTDLYGPVLLYNLVTKETTTLGHHQYGLYDALFEQDNAYFVGYPHVAMHYDPSEPWTISPSNLGSNANPYLIPGIYNGIYNYYATFGVDKLVYIGSFHERNSTGGELVWYNPITGAVGSLRDPFLEDNVVDLKSALGGTKIIYSSNNKLYVVDAASKQIEREIVPVPGGNSLDKIVEVQPGIIFGVTNTQCYEVDIRTGEVLYVKDLGGTAFATPYKFDHRLTKGPDGFVWFTIDKNICRVNPSDGTVEKILLNLATSGIVLFQGRDLYLYGNGSAELQRVKNIFAAENSPYGDVSGDGQVTAYDATLTAQDAVGLIAFTPAQVQAGDVNGNSQITAYDAALIAQRAVGLITKFPVEG